MHPILINDQFIADIVSPFADEDYDLSTEEMDKLPLQLQYVDYKRSTSSTLLDTLIEVMAGVSCSFIFIRYRENFSCVLRKTDELNYETWEFTLFCVNLINQNDLKMLLYLRINLCPWMDRLNGIF